MNKTKNVFLISALMILFLSCKARKIDNAGKINIVCSFFPLYDWTNSIIGGLENETNLTMLEKTGADYHFFTPTETEIKLAKQSDLLICNGGESEKWIFDALIQSENENENRNQKKRKIVNCSEILKNNLIYIEDIEGNSFDEHLWLSVKNAENCAKEICRALCELVPKNKEKYAKNLEFYLEQLENLDLSFKTVAANSKTKTLIFADRFPFAYFAKDYGLECFCAVAGCSKNKTASEETINFLAQKLNLLNLNCVIILDQSNKEIAKKIILEAKNPRCDVFEMDSMQTSSLRNAFNDKTYVYAMQQNLKTLTTALSSSQ